MIFFWWLFDDVTIDVDVDADAGLVWFALRHARLEEGLGRERLDARQALLED